MIDTPPGIGDSQAGQEVAANLLRRQDQQPRRRIKNIRGRIVRRGEDGVGKTIIGGDDVRRAKIGSPLADGICRPTILSEGKESG